MVRLKIYNNCNDPLVRSLLTRRNPCFQYIDLTKGGLYVFDVVAQNGNKGKNLHKNNTSQIYTKALTYS